MLSNGGTTTLSLERERLMILLKRYQADARTPLKAYPDFAGNDLYVNETKLLPTRGRVCVSVDLKLAIPKGFFGQIAGRSGVALFKGISAFNGIIDAGYRDRIYVLLFNFSDDDYTIEKGNRIAQIIIKRCYNNIKFVEYGESEQFPESVRGDKGFGSSLGF